MEWAKPKYSKGKALVKALHDSDQYIYALDVINNWRASHNYPLNTFKVTLRRYASKVDDNFWG